MNKNHFARRAVATVCLAGALALVGTPAHAEEWPEEPGPEIAETVTNEVAAAPAPLGAAAPLAARVMDEPSEPGPGGEEPTPEPEVPVAPTPPVVPDPEAPAVPKPVPQPQIVPAVSDNTVVEAAAVPEYAAPQGQSLAVTGGSDIGFWAATVGGFLVAAAGTLLLVRRSRRGASEASGRMTATGTGDTRS